MSAPEPSGWINDVLVSYACLVLWISLSASVIIYNKHILVTYNFPFPVTLTMIHMGFSSLLATIIVGLKLTDVPHISWKLMLRAIFPIAGLYAVVLSLSNATYVYLSVSFIQMIKAITPASVYCVGCLLGTESWSWKMSANLALVVTGVAISAYGEVHFVVIGVTCQLIAIVLESFRLTMTQLLLQSTGINLNPISTLYFIAPCCFVALIPLFLHLEYQEVASSNFAICPLHLLANATAAFGLNIASFLLLGRTSALTMNVGGVIKDWVLISLSVAIFHNQVTHINLSGYIIAFLGVGWYNYQKVKECKKVSCSTHVTERSSGSSVNSELLVEKPSI